MNGLQTTGVTVAYGGNIAVDRVDLAAPLGRITGLIGPNGAGKTSIFNACNGLLRPSSGAVHLFDVDVTTMGVAARAQAGLGRTFQRVEVCNAMTVAENVALGREAREVGGNPLRHLYSGRPARAATATATDDALEMCGISPIAGRRTATLSTGQRRLLELARVIACDFRLLLLDEPSSGLDGEETAHLGRILRRIVDERGVGILLVEHDMSLVMGVSEYLYVLNFGTKIFEGLAREVRASPSVRAAYLGDEGLTRGRAS